MHRFKNSPIIITKIRKAYIVNTKINNYFSPIYHVYNSISFKFDFSEMFLFLQIELPRDYITLIIKSLCKGEGENF